MKGSEKNCKESCHGTIQTPNMTESTDDAQAAIMYACSGSSG